VPALSVTVKVPANVPAEVGWNITNTVQLAPADNENEVPHWLKTANGPETASLLTDTAVVPVFFRVNGCHAVEVFAGMVPKLRRAGLCVTAPPPPPAAFTVSEIVVVCVSVPDVPVIVTVEVPVVAVALALKVTVLVEVVGLVPNAAVTPAGRPDADRVTLPVNPPDGVTVTMLLALLPCVTATLAGEAESEKLGAATAVTVNEIVVVWVSAPDVPVMVTVEVPVIAVALALKVTVLVEVVGLVPNAAVTPTGRPDVDRVTLPVNPPDGVTVIVLRALEPCVTLTLAGVAESEKFGLLTFAGGKIQLF
jgi:hypothetical protein